MEQRKRSLERTSDKMLNLKNQEIPLRFSVYLDAFSSLNNKKTSTKQRVDDDTLPFSY